MQPDSCSGKGERRLVLVERKVDDKKYNKTEDNSYFKKANKTKNNWGALRIFGRNKEKEIRKLL